MNVCVLAIGSTALLINKIHCKAGHILVEFCSNLFCLQNKPLIFEWLVESTDNCLRQQSHENSKKQDDVFLLGKERGICIVSRNNSVGLY